MSDRTSEFPDDLLSAYFDGEATADERALVERRLRETPELNQTLTEYGELREALQSLPPVPAPVDLKRAVLSQLSPLPTPRAEAATMTRFSRRWLVPAAVSTALVAVVAVSTLALNRNAGNDVAATALPPMSAEKTDAVVVMNSVDGPAAPARTEVSHEVSNTDTDAAQPVLAMTAPAVRSDAPSVEMMRQKLQGLGKVVAPGELIEYLDVVNEQPVIVSYTVVDVMDALDDMQVLLQREGMRPVGALDDEAKNRIMSQVGDDTIAVYLEAPTEQLDQFIQELPVLFEPPVPAEPLAVTDQPGSLLPRPAQADFAPASNSEGQALKPAASMAKEEGYVSDEPLQVVAPVDKQLRQRLQLPPASGDPRPRQQSRADTPPSRDPGRPAEAPATRGGQGEKNKPLGTARRGIILILQSGPD